MTSARATLTFGFAALVATSLVGPSPVAAAGTLGYTIVNVGPQDSGGDPSLRVTNDGHVYVSYPASTGASTYRSVDQGSTWTATAIADRSSGENCMAGDGAGGLYLCNLAGSADAAPLQADVWKSIDGGDHWALAHGPADRVSIAPGSQSIAGASSNPFGVDRPWIDAWVPPGRVGTDQAEVVLGYRDFSSPSRIWANVSTDGGKTFGAPVDVMASPANNITARENAAVAAAYSLCNAEPTAVDIVKAGPQAGRIWVAWIAGDAATSAATGCSATQLATLHSLWTAYSDDGGATWNAALAFDGGVGHDAATPLAAFTLDDQGNPYYAFAMNIGSSYDVWVLWSNDGGTTWSGQGTIGALGSQGQAYKVDGDTGTHIFPAIVAGHPGHVDIAYLATPSVVPTLPTGKFQPGGGAGDKWYLWLAQGDLTTAPGPTWTRTQINPDADPMHVGDICNLRTLCVDGTVNSLAGGLVPPFAILGTNRDLLDFISLDLDAQGFAHVAYADDNPSDTGNGLLGIDVVNQTSGGSLFVGP